MVMGAVVTPEAMTYAGGVVWRGRFFGGLFILAPSSIMAYVTMKIAQFGFWSLVGGISGESSVRMG